LIHSVVRAQLRESAKLLNRRCIGFELNPVYVEIARRRLSRPFEGFDSADPRVERVPMDTPQQAAPVTASKQMLLLEGKNEYECPPNGFVRAAGPRRARKR
jgi:hypothetical protein